jgi:hypothetical protein
MAVKSEAKLNQPKLMSLIGSAKSLRRANRVKLKQSESEQHYGREGRKWQWTKCLRGERQSRVE